MADLLAPINLYKEQDSLSPQLHNWSVKLHRIASLILLLCVVLSVSAYGGSFVAQKIRDAQQAQKDTFVQQIDAQRQKEGLFLALRDRVSIVDRAIQSQKNWAKAIEIATSISKPPVLSDITLGDDETVIATFHVPSLEDALSLVDTVGTLVKIRSLRRPQLSALNIDKDGAIEMVLTFFPNL